MSSHHHVPNSLAESIGCDCRARTNESWYEPYNHIPHREASCPVFHFCLWGSAVNSPASSTSFPAGALTIQFKDNNASGVSISVEEMLRHEPNIVPYRGSMRFFILDGCFAKCYINLGSRIA